MKLWSKKVTVPATNETKEVEAVQLWYVKWEAVDVTNTILISGEKVAYVFNKIEAFPSEKEAEDFAQALVQANDLIGNKQYSAPLITKN